MSPRFTLPRPLPLSGPLLQLSALIVLLTFARPAHGRRQYDQFKVFFPSWQDTLRGIRDNNCSELYLKYKDEEDPDQQTTFDLTSCILTNMGELSKVEMSITAILLGLLPTVLQRVGPTVAEVSLLSLRRPILAAMLALGCPCVSESHDNAFDNAVNALAKASKEYGDDDDTEVVLRHRTTGVMKVLRVWRDRSNWIVVVISTVEYLLAAAAVFNVVYQAYQLSYWSVSVSAVAIKALLPETYAPFLWTFLIIPVHLVGVVVMTLRVEAKKGHGIDRNWKMMIKDELKPCVFGRELSIEKQEDRTLKHDLSLLISKWLLFMGVWCYVIYGTVALSSQLFISLNDVCPIIARYIGGAITCRMVLMFELHGMRDVTQRNTDTIVYSKSLRRAHRKAEMVVPASEPLPFIVGQGGKRRTGEHENGSEQEIQVMKSPEIEERVRMMA